MEDMIIDTSQDDLHEVIEQIVSETFVDETTVTEISFETSVDETTITEIAVEEEIKNGVMGIFGLLFFGFCLLVIYMLYKIFGWFF